MQDESELVGEEPAAHPFAVLPGGHTPQPEDAAAAGILLGLALLLYLLRRAAGRTDHVHTSAIDAVSVFAMVAIGTALWRLGATWLASDERGDLANTIARAMAFFT
jgi:hypothetical protein